MEWFSKINKGGSALINELTVLPLLPGSGPSNKEKAAFAQLLP